MKGRKRPTCEELASAVLNHPLTRESNLQVSPDTLPFLSFFFPTAICKYFVVVFGVSEVLTWVIKLGRLAQAGVGMILQTP